VYIRSFDYKGNVVMADAFVDGKMVSKQSGPVRNTVNVSLFPNAEPVKHEVSHASMLIT
jgi:hypothetical protein